MKRSRTIHATLEPAWADWRRLRHAQVPAPVYHWLRDTGSLTARIKGCCDGRFRVRVISQGWGRALNSENELLRMRCGEWAIVREVQLLCAGTPWVFARTLIPASSLKGAARRLTLLGSRPLGQVLFSDSQVRRGRTEVARLLPRHSLFATATSGLEPGASEIWGRRTLFHLTGHPLLVNEIFLPEAIGRYR
ncbi:MAG: chorismate lyase [Candidatus Sedimenticola endophacoides]